MGRSVTTPGSVTSGAEPEVGQSKLGLEVKCQCHESIDYMIYDYRVYVFFVGVPIVFQRVLAHSRYKINIYRMTKLINY